VIARANLKETAMNELNAMDVLDIFLNWVSNGLLDLSWWQVLLVTLVLTHVTIASVTIYLHRHQAHRALDLHPIASHFFRFWLWMTTGMVTREWAAIHRKHHAKCEREGDPHSPVVYGIRKVFWQGSELYRAEAKNQETLQRYGHGTPDDWIERNLYTRYSALGVSLMLIIDVLLFGALGLTVWAVQMAWIPVTAAGVINGIGHWWGYRNFEAQDASTNISPWGILIGGEELHNNHHTFPTSAKLSVKSYEFDIGWAYIRALSVVGLAKVKKTPPKLAFGEVRSAPDAQTLEALIANRYEMMAQYAKHVRAAVVAESAKFKAEMALAKLTQRWLHRDEEKIPPHVREQLQLARRISPMLDNMVRMREELRHIWENTALNKEQLLEQLQAWCKRAEDSGIAALTEFSMLLRAAKLRMA
jgi:stearoyl-CoA desaturase (Delta-9 desaturase)